MILLDTNVFVIDRFYPGNEKFDENRRFVEQLPGIEVGFPVFSLYELCGVSSFRLSPEELNRWMYNLEDAYDVEILPQFGMRGELATNWFRGFQAHLRDLIRRKMSLGDALILQAAEEYNVDAIITWNLKHFIDRTTIPVLTPTEYLAQQKPEDDDNR